METSSKEIKSTQEILQAPAPSLAYYGDREFDLNVFGAYALTGTDYLNDRYLGTDHAFGGGLAAKYFFRRYFGVGIEGFGLAARGTSYRVEEFGGSLTSKSRDDHAVGGVLGTLTLRYPIGYTRFSPYVWAGGGGIFGGHNRTAIYANGTLERISHDVESRGMGQFGGGLEYRITRHIGLTSDFSWNVVEGAYNNFGTVRSGLTFSF